MKLIIFGSPPPRYDLARSHICMLLWLTECCDILWKKEASRRATKNGKKSSKRLDWVSLSAWATSRPLTCSSQSSLLCCFFSSFVYWWRRVVGWARERDVICRVTGQIVEFLQSNWMIIVNFKDAIWGRLLKTFFLIDSWILIFRIRTWNVKTNVKSKWVKLFGQFQYKTSKQRWKFQADEFEVWRSHLHHTIMRIKKVSPNCRKRLTMFVNRSYGWD